MLNAAGISQPRIHIQNYFLKKTFCQEKKVILRHPGRPQGSKDSKPRAKKCPHIVIKPLDGCEVRHGDFQPVASHPESSVNNGNANLLLATFLQQLSANLYKVALLQAINADPGRADRWPLLGAPGPGFRPETVNMANMFFYDGSR